jgi:hypothetical protein
VAGQAVFAGVRAVATPLSQSEVVIVAGSPAGSGCVARRCTAASCTNVPLSTACSTPRGVAIVGNNVFVVHAAGVEQLTLEPFAFQASFDGTFGDAQSAPVVVGDCAVFGANGPGFEGRLGLIGAGTGTLTAGPIEHDPAVGDLTALAVSGTGSLVGFGEAGVPFVFDAPDSLCTSGRASPIQAGPVRPLAQMTAMTFIGDDLWVGTVRGEVWRLPRSVAP